MDTHPIQASPHRWIVALGLLLVAGVQGLFLWGYKDDGIWVSLLDGKMCIRDRSTLPPFIVLIIGLVSACGKAGQPKLRPNLPDLQTDGLAYAAP